MSQQKKTSAGTWRHIRRCALAGQWETVRRLLSDLMDQSPEDSLARQEWERLEKGIPLQILEKPRQRRAREAQEAQEKAKLLISRYPEERLRSLSSAGLSSLLSEFNSHLQAIRRGGMPQGNALLAFGKDIKKKIRSKRMRSLRKALLWAGSGAFLLALATVSFFSLRNRAKELDAQLRQALEARQWERVHSILKASDTGINRLLCPDLPIAVSEAEKWIAASEASYKKLHQQIADLEQGKAHMASLNMLQRHELESQLRVLPRELGDLAARWEALRHQEKSRLLLRKSAIAEDLSSPLPPYPPYMGNPEQDRRLLLSQLRELEERRRLFERAAGSLDLPKELAPPLDERLKRLQSDLKDIDQLHALSLRLPYARSYAQYREWLNTLPSSATYPLAIQLLALREKLPEAEDLREMMQDHEQALPPGMLEAAEQTLIHGKPTFTPAFPANAMQVALMEDPFTSGSLHRRLTELSYGQGQVNYTEDELKLGEQGSVTFRLSDLDPAFRVGESNIITYPYARGVWKKDIDTRPLLRACGMERDAFFREANLPRVLTTVLQYRNKRCPALAQAYLYSRLIQLLKAHDHPLMTGINYAPTLKEDIRSFSALTATLGMALAPGCWLGSSPEQTQAEEAYARWFWERRFHHYAREISRNFQALTQVHPRYCGYIGEDGRPLLHTALPPETLLWHLSKGNITTSTAGGEWDSPDLFSPVFTIKRSPSESTE